MTRASSITDSVNRRFVTLLAVAVLGVAIQAQDGYPISTDRPSFSDTPNIIPMGRWQLESGFTFNKVGSSELTTYGEVLLRFPLSPNLEMRLSNLTYGRANAAGSGGSGWLDPVVGMKYKFHSGTAGKSPDLAVVAQSTLPWGARDFRTDASQPTLKLAGYYQADSDDGLGWNVVWSHLGAGATDFDQWALGAYWSTTVNSKTGFFVEFYHLMPVSNGGPHATFFDTGVAILLDKATQIDFRVGSGLNQSRDGWTLGAGISFRF